MFENKTLAIFPFKYKEVYLLRNEEVYKIYDFKKGRGFQPDFILFLKDKKKQDLHYQVFIEPKGDNLLTNDESVWKNEFLKEFSEKYGDKNILKLENKAYSLIWFPLYNKQDASSFNNEFEKLLKA